MSMIAQFELWLAISIALTALSVVVAILMTIAHFRYREKLSWWVEATFLSISLMSLSAGYLAATFAWGLWEEPSTYTRQVGIPQIVRIEHLEFLPGTRGYDSVVRVDTDRGLYFLDGYTPIPKAGTVYAVERMKFWGTDTQVFLCRNVSLVQCWPVLTNLRSNR